MGRSVIRVRASGMVYGYRPGDPEEHATVLVLPGEHGNLLQQGSDGCTVEWDHGFLQDGESADGSLERAGPVVVFSPDAQEAIVVTSVIDLPDDEDDPLPGADIDGIVDGRYDEPDDAARLLIMAAGEMEQFAGTMGAIARQIARLVRREDEDAE